MPARCEIVEVRNLADAVGYSCSRTASTECSDCGTELCESHIETCSGCSSIFCPSCFFFHQSTQHPKPAERPSLPLGRIWEVTAIRAQADECVHIPFRDTMNRIVATEASAMPHGI